jgi:hypothetical protein
MAAIVSWIENALIADLFLLMLRRSIIIMKRGIWIIEIVKEYI